MHGGRPSGAASARVSGGAALGGWGLGRKSAGTLHARILDWEGAAPAAPNASTADPSDLSPESRVPSPDRARLRARLRWLDFR